MRGKGRVLYSGESPHEQIVREVVVELDSLALLQENSNKIEELLLFAPVVRGEGAVQQSVYGIGNLFCLWLLYVYLYYVLLI